MPLSADASQLTRTRSPSVWRSFVLVLLSLGLVATGRSGWLSSDVDPPSLAVAAQTVDDLGEDWPAKRCAADRLLESPAWLAIGSPQGRIGDEPAALCHCGDRQLWLRGPLWVTQVRGRCVGSLWASLQTREVRLQV